MNKREEFRKELESLINRYSMENGSNTPDFILATYLMSCLEAFDVATATRTKWYGVDETINQPVQTDFSLALTPDQERHLALLRQWYQQSTSSSQILGNPPEFTYPWELKACLPNP